MTENGSILLAIDRCRSLDKTRQNPAYLALFFFGCGGVRIMLAVCALTGFIEGDNLCTVLEGVEVV